MKIFARQVTSQREEQLSFLSRERESRHEMEPKRASLVHPASAEAPLLRASTPWLFLSLPPSLAPLWLLLLCLCLCAFFVVGEAGSSQGWGQPAAVECVGFPSRAASSGTESCGEGCWAAGRPEAWGRADLMAQSRSFVLFFSHLLESNTFQD